MLSDFGTDVSGEFGVSNQLSMATIQSIETLHRSGHSNREIARILGIDRGAVNNYVKRMRAVEAAPAVATTSSEDLQNRPKPRMPQTGKEAIVVLPSFPGRSGPKSLCEQYREVIVAKLDQRLSAVRIHLDLKTEHSFVGSYHSIRRYIDRLGIKKPLPFRHMEVNPGDGRRSSD